MGARETQEMVRAPAAACPPSRACGAQARVQSAHMDATRTELDPGSKHLKAARLHEE
jgi:hypothetical protein